MYIVKPVLRGYLSFLCCTVECLYVLSSCDLRLFAYNGVQHILCCVFILVFFVLLPVSLDCPVLVAPSVFSNVYINHTTRLHSLSFLYLE